MIGRDGDRDEVIRKYTTWVGKSLKDGTPETLQRFASLHGKDLVCWCAPEPCHADVLKGFAIRARRELDDKT